ncbi:hypothetical protein VB796_05380 [Arcicella sp. LKC2W]|nr:hypothetical protein [Arcicella sp. LKC2W]MEA5458458.1 hypothetical protein [Arcicella sp. LKC2W]
MKKDVENHQDIELLVTDVTQDLRLSISDAILTSTFLSTKVILL